MDNSDTRINQKLTTMKTKHLREITNDNCLHPVTNSNLKAWVAWDDGTRKC